MTSSNRRKSTLIDNNYRNNMSRSIIPKSRLDKSRNTPMSTLTPIPPIAVDIIPGRFTEADWYSLLQTEEGEVNVSSIVEEITDRAMESILTIYLETELIAFTIGQAKDAILQIIAWQFLIHDPGEVNIQDNPSWQEDEEPLTYITDSWAQGSVPVMCIRPASTAPEDQEVCEEKSRTEERDQQALRESQKPTKVIHSPQAAADMAQTDTKQPAIRKLKAQCRCKKRPIADSKHQIPAQELTPEPGFANNMPIQYTVLAHPQSCQQEANANMTDHQLRSVTGGRRLDPLPLPKHQIQAQFEVLEPTAAELEKPRCGPPKCGPSTTCRKAARIDRRVPLRPRHQWSLSHACPDGESSQPNALSHEPSVPLISCSAHADSLILRGREDLQLEKHALFPSIIPRYVERGPLAGQLQSSAWESQPLKPISTTVAVPALCVQTLLQQRGPHIRPESALLPSTPTH